MIRFVSWGRYFFPLRNHNQPKKEQTMTYDFDKYEKFRKREQARKKKEWEKRASKILNDWIDTWINEPDTQPTKNQ